MCRVDHKRKLRREQRESRTVRPTVGLRHHLCKRVGHQRTLEPVLRDVDQVDEQSGTAKSNL